MLPRIFWKRFRLQSTVLKYLLKDHQIKLEPLLGQTINIKHCQGPFMDNTARSHFVCLQHMGRYKYLTDHYEILRKYLQGDIVLADRGFDISESVGMMQTKLHIPAFTKGKSQLSPLQVENTYTIANVQIHVERVIGCVRQKYTILQETLPVDFLTVSKVPFE